MHDTLGDSKSLKNCTMLSKPKVRILAEYPLPIVCGGLELQCLRTFSALQRKGANVKLLDYHDPTDEFDLLHIFGNPAGLFEIVFHANKTKRIIISAVCGAQGWMNFRMKRRILLSKIIGCARQKTDYARLRFMFNTADHIICINELEKMFISKTYDIIPSKLTIINNGVEDQYFSATPYHFYNKYGIKDFVLFTGNIVKRKNPVKLAKVLKKMGIKGVFIGGVTGAEHEYAAQFEEIVFSAPNLLWIKGVLYNDPIIVSAYAAASLFCLPSSGETQSLSALEAMAAATPIILGDMPYARQLPFQGVMRCNPEVEKSIESSIRKTLNSPDKYRKRLPRSFTWDNVASNVIRVYDGVISS